MDVTNIDTCTTVINLTCPLPPLPRADPIFLLAGDPRPHRCPLPLPRCARAWLDLCAHCGCLPSPPSLELALAGAPPAQPPPLPLIRSSISPLSSWPSFPNPLFF